MTVINAFAAAAEGAGASQADSFEVALNSVVQVMKSRVGSNLTINLTDTDDLADIKTQVTTDVVSVANVDTDAFGAMADDTTTAIMNVNVKINEVTDIGTVVAKNVFSTAQVLNIQIKNGVSAEVAAVGTGTINFIEASAVEAAATNLAPTDITITLPSLAIISNPEISEDADSLLVGTLGAVDEDQAAGVAHTYAIVGSSDTDSASFNINALTGELSFNALPDYEAQSTYKVSVTTTDDGDKTYSETITISVKDVDEAAVITGTSAGSITEDDEGSLDDAGFLVVTGALIITDPDADDTPVFSAQSNTVAETISGAAGLGKFDLTVGGAWTYKVDNAKSAIQELGIGETVTDKFTAVSDDGTTQVVSVTITGINDAAVITGTKTGNVTEDLNLSDSGDLVANGTLTVTDPDTGQAVFIEQLSTVGSLGLGVFALETNGSWTYTADNSQIAVQALGNNVKAVDTFTAVAAGGTEQIVTVTFTGVNDADVIGGDLAASVLEDSGTVLTVSGALTVTDADAGDSPTFVAQTNTTGSGNWGEFTLMTDGSWSYTVDNALAAVQALSAGVNKIETFSVATVNGAIENVNVTILGALEPVELSLIESTVNSGGFVINGVSANDQSGRSVSNAGDVNGDGFDDVIIGAHRDDPNGKAESGASFVVFGKENGHVELSAVEVNGQHGLGFVINGVGAGDYAGQSVSAAGDVNGDGFDDLLVGAPLTDPNDEWSGSAYLVYGKNDNVPVALSALRTDANLGGFVIQGLAEGNFTGQSVSDAGDVNGDGYDDIIIGAHKAGPNDPASGASYVIYGRPDVGGNKIGTAIDLTEIEADTGGFVINGVAENDQSGLSVSGAGDVNGDGFDDVIVGAPFDDPNGDLSGASFVVFGSAEGVGVELTALEAAAGADPTGFVINGVAADDQSAISVSGAGDVNGDGLDDLIVGAMGADPNGSLSGASYVVFGKADGAAVELSAVELNAGAVPTGFIIKGISTDDFSGRSVSGAGDVNGDGLDDLIIGAMGTDNSRDVDGDGDEDLTSGSGSSFVVYGKTGGEAVELSLVASSVGGFVINGVNADDQSGRSVSGAGDVNGDGFADLIVGAPFDDPNGNSYSGASSPSQLHTLERVPRKPLLEQLRMT
jgi:VCBS repeat-containing protein